MGVHFPRHSGSNLAVAFVIGWEGIVRLGAVSPLVLAPPSSVGLAFLKDIDGVSRDLGVTLKHVGIGLVWGSLVGLGLGLVVGWYKRAEETLGTILYALYPIPIVTFLPLFVLWLGLGDRPIYAATAMGAFFPIFVNTVVGVKNVDRRYMEVFWNFSTDERKLFRQVIFPASLPQISAGFRLSIGIALILATVAEMILSPREIGGMIWKAVDTFRTEEVILGQMLLALVGVVLFRLHTAFESWRIVFWLPRRERP